MPENPHYGYTESGLYIPDPAHMARAIELGHACIETSDHPVGAVVVSAAGVILGEGKNEVHVRSTPTAHAEVLAIRSAADAVGRTGLEGGVLFTSHECCPMCAGAVANTKLAGCVYSTSVEDVTELVVARKEIKWRSNVVRMQEILASREEKDVPKQFVIGGFMREQGLELLERASELAA
jgi:tRNA(Arg) A34 adenosine deaminase TadA